MGEAAAETTSKISEQAFEIKALDLELKLNELSLAENSEIDGEVAKLVELNAEVEAFEAEMAEMETQHASQIEALESKLAEHKGRPQWARLAVNSWGRIIRFVFGRGS